MAALGDLSQAWNLARGRAAVRLSPELIERKQDVGGVSVQLREWGDSGMPVVFWHAPGDHSSMQMAEAGPILVKDYGLHVVGVDAPGFGGSISRLPDAQYEFSALNAFIGRLLDVLELDRPAWVGSSWGAYLGVAAAGSFPDTIRALALLDGGYWQDPEEPYLTYSLEALREEERARPDYRWPSWEAAYAEYREWAGRWSPELERYVHSVMREEGEEIVSIMGPDVFAAALYGLLHADLAAMQSQLAATEIPVLLLSADADPEHEKMRDECLRGFQTRLPRAEVRRVSVPHLMLEAQPDAVAQIIGPWLSSYA